MKVHRLILSAVAIVAMVSIPAIAASNRVFVSSSGMDVGSCTPVTSPCRNFAYAMTQVSAGGEIIALSTAGYGPVTVTQSVSIIAAPGVTAFIAASMGSGVYINAGPTDVITLRGIAFNSTGGFAGIGFAAGWSLNVENCIINGFNGNAIDFTRMNDSTKPRMQVLNSILRNNSVGIWIFNYGPGSPLGGPAPVGAYVTIANTTFSNNSDGMFVNDNAHAVVSDSVFAGNFFGIYCHAQDSYSLPEITLERCELSRNLIGIQNGGQGPGNPGPIALVRIANCMITANDTGVETDSGGVLLSRLSTGIVTNTIHGNGTDVVGAVGTYNAK